MTECGATTDIKCWQESSAGVCAKCWWPYWFQGTICAGANLMKGVTGLIITIIFCYFI